MKYFNKCLLTLIVGSAIVPMVYAQTCSSQINTTTPHSRYEIITGSNGSEVKDIRTGLIWQRCSAGQIWSNNQCYGTAQSYTWTEALQKSKALGNGYRLPNIKELQSLIEEACTGPTMNETIFSVAINDYWSSTPKMGDNRYAWSVNFDEGTVNSSSIYYKTSKRFNVRAVRNSD